MHPPGALGVPVQLLVLGDQVDVYQPLWFHPQQALLLIFSHPNWVHGWLANLHGQFPPPIRPNIECPAGQPPMSPPYCQPGTMAPIGAGRQTLPIYKCV